MPFSGTFTYFVDKIFFTVLTGAIILAKPLACRLGLTDAGAVPSHSSLSAPLGPEEERQAMPPVPFGRQGKEQAPDFSAPTVSAVRNRGHVHA